jgi:intracellular septation protein
MEKTINPILKQALELGPLVLFFAGFFLLKADSYTVAGHLVSRFILLTALFVPLTIIATGVLWLLTGSLSRMQVFTLVLVVIMGGLSVWLNDERYIKMKPTALYLGFSAILFFGLWRGKSYLAALMGSVLPMEPAGWMILTRRFAVFFLALAAVNEIIWRSMSTGTWLSFKLFGVTGAMFLFLLAQHKVFSTYMIEDKAPEKE